jgi:hypothetical protein
MQMIPKYKWTANSSSPGGIVNINKKKGKYTKTPTHRKAQTIKASPNLQYRNIPTPQHVHRPYRATNQSAAQTSACRE